MPVYLQPGGSYLCTPRFTSTLEELYSLLLLKRGGKITPFFLTTPMQPCCIMLYYNNILSCGKQRRKQQSQQPTQTLKPPELEFLLRDVPSEVSNPYRSALLRLSLDQRSPAIPTQLEKSLWAPSPGKQAREKTKQLYDAAGCRVIRTTLLLHESFQSSLLFNHSCWSQKSLILWDT